MHGHTGNSVSELTKMQMGSVAVTWVILSILLGSKETVEGIPLKSKPAVRGQQGDFANGIS